MSKPVLFLIAMIAGYALLGLTILLSGPLAPFISVMQIVAVIDVVLFSLVIIYMALKALFSGLK